jgi:hypothetical protein
MKPLLLVLSFFPFIAFLSAGVMELRTDRGFAQKLGKLIPVILGLAAFTIFLNPQLFLHITASSSVPISRGMTFLCVLIALSGAFVNYSRRGSSALIVAGGLLMAFFWMFFGQVRV